MQTQSARRSTIWMATGVVPQPGPLCSDIQVDVCVIGAGIAGLTTADLLAQEGKLVAVLDDGPVAGGNTRCSTAHLTAVLDRRFTELERLHGRDRTRQIVASHMAAIDQIEGIARSEGISCDFARVDGYLFSPAGAGSDALDPELEAAHRAGLVDAEKLGQVPLGSFKSGASLRFPNQAQFHPLRYAAGLVRAILREGGRIFTNTHATTIEGNGPAQVYTGAGPVVSADQVVLATNAPIGNRFSVHTKQSARLSYVIGAMIPRGSVPRGLFWDTEEPSHYVRVQSLSPSEIWSVEPELGTHEVLLVGGEDHKTGQVNDHGHRYDRLEHWARKRFPMIESVRFRWSGQVLDSMDGIGFIGRNPLDSPSVFITTGDSGNGMTHGTLAGMILCDLIMGRENPWAALYDPSRITVRAGGRYLRESLNVLAQYGRWLTPGDVSSVDDLAPDTGAVIRRGMTKIAVYRDTRGQLHHRSAVCPHLGSIVSWNQADRTFDSPFHGSRFDCFGNLINGPANRDLARVYELEAPLLQPGSEPTLGRVAPSF